MEKKDLDPTPRRITDLVELKDRSSEVTIDPTFEILPVDFFHKDHQFQAYIFLCRYSGTVDGRAFRFRKCYARGCPHNLCPQVAQAVMVANHYLLRDFRRLQQAGITVPEKVFTLDEMVVQFEDLKETQGPLMTIPDFIALAKEGNAFSLEAKSGIRSRGGAFCQ